MVVRVQTAAGAVGEGLGHMRGNRAVFFGNLRAGHLEEDNPIAGRQRVGVIKIDFVLPIAVLVVALVNSPIERVERQG